MNPKPAFEHFVYGLVIILSLVAVALVALAPDFMAGQLVYRGF
jgi:hypothetical protein